MTIPQILAPLCFVATLAAGLWANKQLRLAEQMARRIEESHRLIVRENDIYAVRSLYREVLARGDKERSRLREREAQRQQSMFSEERN